MILTDRIARAVAAGDVTVAYRRWARSRVKPGETFRTVAGIVRVDAVEQADPGRLSDSDARRAGHDSLGELAATFRGEESDPLFRIRLSWLGPDPREALAATTDLAPGDLGDIDALLDHLDARTPWARAVLRRIADEPGITAAALAEGLPIGKESLKRRIRTLKEHGLTRSLTAGYELSARGAAYLTAGARRRGGPGSSGSVPPG